MATPAETRELLARLAALDAACKPENPWWVKKEPHKHNDGTTDFIHVFGTAHDVNGNEIQIEIGSYLTADLAELMVLSRNNISTLITLARKGLDVVDAGGGDG